MGSALSSLWPVGPFAAGCAVAVTLAVLWISSYILDWLNQLDAGTRTLGAEAHFEDPNSLDKVPLPSILAPAQKYLSLVTPAFNEEARIAPALEEALRYLKERSRKDKFFTYEIIVVDDGSVDNTVKVVLEFTKKHGLDTVRVVKQHRNQGKGAAVRKGMLCARGELILFFDSDGATKITDLEKLELEIQEAAAEVTLKHLISKTSKEKNEAGLGDIPAAAFGSRAHLEKQALATRKWYRNVLMLGFHWCVLLVAGSGVRDTQCGFKMFTRSAAKLLFFNQRLNRWCFDVELVYLCKRLKVPIREVSVTWTEIPGSKIRITSILHMLLEMALIRLGYGFRFWRIHRGFSKL